MTPFETWLKQPRAGADLCSTTLKFVYDASNSNPALSFYEPKNMILGASVTKLYQYILQFLSSRARSKYKIWIQIPNYDVLWHIPFELGLEVHFFVVAEDIVINDQILAIVISDPNNPTGARTDRDHLLSITQNIGAYLIVDAIFAPIPFQKLLHRPLPVIRELEIIISSLWKCFQIPGVAYAQFSDPILRQEPSKEVYSAWVKNLGCLAQVRAQDFDFLSVNKKMASNIFNCDLDLCETWFTLIDTNSISKLGVPSHFFKNDMNKYRVSWGARNFSEIVGA